jgi:hypothetical protein
MTDYKCTHSFESVETHKLKIGADDMEIIAVENAIFSKIAFAQVHVIST